MKKPYRILLIVSALLALIIISYCYGKSYSARAELARRYENGLKVVFDYRNEYCPEAQMAYFDSCLGGSSYVTRQSVGLLGWKGLGYLKLGEEKKAVDLLGKLVLNTSVTPDDATGIDARRELAMAYLRLGEKNNCISGHSASSCIFPIRDRGIYNDPSGSEKAIALFQEVLRYDSTDLQSRWLLNMAYMTIGEYPDNVPADLLIPGLDKDTSSVAVRPFEDMSSRLRLNSFRSEAGGAVVDDFNNDGYLDIIISSVDLNQSMHYFRNNADGTFTDASVSSGLSRIKGGLNLIQADYNNDGFTDILVLRGGWMGEFGKQPNTLLRNNGNGTFTDVTLESGLTSFHPTQTAAWADFNNDGWPDLFIGNETSSPEYPHPCELYINNRNGTFTNVAAESGVAVLGFVKGVTADDYNRDGWPDIFISTADGKRMLLKNRGLKSRIPQFTDATQEAGLGREAIYTFPTCFMDYNNDGWPDIFACGYRYRGTISETAAKEALGRPLGDVGKMYLYRNNHDGTFTNVSKQAGLDHPVFSMGFNFGDIDNDGFPDMYLGTGNPDFQSLVPNRLFKNIGGQRFADVTRSARVGNLQKGHGVSFADIDNDGDQDIFTVLGGAYVGDGYYNSLYMNPGQNANRWISVQLEGTKSNRSAIGAVIEVSFTENGVKRTVYQDVNSGGSFGSSPFRKEIGIGKAEMIDEMTIKWPSSGIVQVFKNIRRGQFLKIREGSNQLIRMNLKVLDFRSQPLLPMIDCAP